MDGSNPAGRFTSQNHCAELLADGPLLVARLVDPTEIPGYDAALAGLIQASPEPVEISLHEVIATFPGMSVYAFRGAEIVKIGGSGAELSETVVDPAHFYPT
jgi:hypothetical protein